MGHFRASSGQLAHVQNACIAFQGNMQAWLISNGQVVQCPTMACMQLLRNDSPFGDETSPQANLLLTHTAVHSKHVAWNSNRFQFMCERAAAVATTRSVPHLSPMSLHEWLTAVSAQPVESLQPSKLKQEEGEWESRMLEHGAVA